MPVGAVMTVRLSVSITASVTVPGGPNPVSTDDPSGSLTTWSTEVRAKSGCA